MTERAAPGAQRALARLHADIRACTRCPLHRTRTQAVPGVGPAGARVMLVGEAPGRQEDERGEPFVGPAGRFLDELLASAGLQRREVYITNVVKSRPFIGPAPGRNRPPGRSEIAACRSWLDEQIRIIRPEVIVALGGVALGYCAPALKISQVHGRPLSREGRIVLPVFHPAVAARWRELREILRRDFLVLQGLAEPDRAPRPSGERSRLGGRAGGGQEGSRRPQKRSG